jgi:membrane protein implicated in regulation of membrane protease activity
MKVRRTRAGRCLVLWVATFFATVALVAYPTAYQWPFWLYGLVWGGSTTLFHYLLRRFLEEEVEV